MYATKRVCSLSRPYPGSHPPHAACQVLDILNCSRRRSDCTTKEDRYLYVLYLHLSRLLSSPGLLFNHLTRCSIGRRVPSTAALPRSAPQTLDAHLSGRGPKQPTKTVGSATDLPKLDTELLLLVSHGSSIVRLRRSDSPVQTLNTSNHFPHSLLRKPFSSQTLPPTLANTRVCPALYI